MFIVTIIVQLGVFLDTRSQLATAHLDKLVLIVRFQSFFIMNQITQKLSQRWALLNWDTTYFLLNALTAISQSTFNLLA